MSGADVSSSTTRMLVSGRSAFTALAIPVKSPPPPQGTMIVSTSGKSSRISRPIVPFPAMTGSSSTGWTKKPSTPG